MLVGENLSCVVKCMRCMMLLVEMVGVILEERGGFAVSVEVLVTCIAPFKP